MTHIIIIIISIIILSATSSSGDQMIVSETLAPMPWYMTSVAL